MTGKITGPLREQSDWEQQDENRLGFIKNKPFYDARKTAPLTIEWDGNTDGKESVYFPMSENTYYKLSEIAPTTEELPQSECVFYMCGTHPEEPFEQEIHVTLTGDVEGLKDENGNEGWLVSDETIGGIFLIIIPKELIIPVGIFGNETELCLTKGLWSFAIHEVIEGNEFHAFTKRLYFPSVTTGELKTIDPKFLPSGGGSGLPLLICAEPQSPTKIVGEAKNMTYSDVVKAFNEGTLYGAFCNWMGRNLIPCSIDIGLATDAEQPYIDIELVERTDGPAIQLCWTPDGNISNQLPYSTEE